MSISVIQLTLNQVALIKGASEAAYPKEACGLIAGRLVSEGVLSVTRIVRSNNILAATTDDRFEIDPSDRIELEKMIRGTLETLIAHYHSHPDKDAVPSSIDLMNTHAPFSSCMFRIGLQKKKMKRLSSFLLHNFFSRAKLRGLSRVISPQKMSVFE